MSPVRPKTVGTCLVQEQIGKGGMAEVFRGLQEPLNRPVAVKAILPERKDDPEAKERLKREALALAALHHENIVAVHDLVEKYNRLYLIMEFVDGVDLATVLGKGPVPIDIGLLIGSEVASALEHAHFRKLIHRDVKPPNVMLSRAGQVKLTDFGIAKDQTMDDLTRQGMVVGTLDYLGPERIGGGRADWRTDIYALGVTLYEAFAGVRPFAGEEHDEIIGNIICGRHQRLRKVAPHLPRSIERIVHRCLELVPAKRYQRAAELRRDLDRLLGAVLKGTPSARLVAFLKERNLVGEADLTMISSDEVEVSKPVPRPETVLKSRRFERPAGARGVGWTVLIVLLSLLLVAGGLSATFFLAPDWSSGILERTAAWVSSARQPD